VASIVDQLQQMHSIQDKTERSLQRRLEMTAGRFSPLETVVMQKLEELDSPVSGLLNLNASLVNSQNIAETMDCCVEGIVLDAVYFSALLSLANSKGDKRVRFQWSDFGLERWKMGDHKFDVSIGIDLIESVPNVSRFLRILRECMKLHGVVMLFDSQLLEPFNGLSAQSLKNYGFELVSYTRCSEEVKHAYRDFSMGFDRQAAVITEQAYWKEWHEAHPNWTQFVLRAI